jgi:hypothetical protein
MEGTIKTKRWWIYFLVFFVIWYPISFILYTMYSVTLNPLFYLGITVFGALFLLFLSYRYFKNAQNDWNNRFITAFGWYVLTLILAAILVRPLYGFHWTSIINSSIIYIDWINVVAVLVGGLVAQRQIPETMITPPASSTPSKY